MADHINLPDPAPNATIELRLNSHHAKRAESATGSRRDWSVHYGKTSPRLIHHVNDVAYSRVPTLTVLDLLTEHTVTLSVVVLPLVIAIGESAGLSRRHFAYAGRAAECTVAERIAVHTVSGRRGSVTKGGNCYGL